MNHSITDMGQRSVHCECGRHFELSGDEFLSLSLEAGADLLLDRHKAHVVNIAERGL